MANFKDKFKKNHGTEVKKSIFSVQNEPEKEIKEVIMEEEPKVGGITIEELTPAKNKVVISKPKLKNDEKEFTTLSLTSDASKLLTTATKVSKKKVNTIINEVLNEVYDPKTKSLNIDVKPKEKNKSHSVQISKEIRNELAKQAKKKKMTIGELVSEILLDYIEIE